MRSDRATAWWWTAAGVGAAVIAVGLSIGAAGIAVADDPNSPTVRPKGGSVKQDEAIDFGDEEEKKPDKVEDAPAAGDGSARIRITSMTLVPPPGYVFRQFTDNEQQIVNPQATNPLGEYPNTWLDLSAGPPTPDEPDIEQAGPDAIRLSAVYPKAQHAGQFRLRVEGNMRPTGGGVGPPPQVHWSVKARDYTFAHVLDLDVDTDNTNGPRVAMAPGAAEGTPPESIGFDPPDRSTEEDTIEADLPGKLVVVGETDQDDDDIPGYADGYTIEELGELGDNVGPNAAYCFVPVVVQIPSDVLAGGAANVTVRFTYADSNPQAMTVTPDDSPDGWLYTPGPGYWRLWTVDGPTPRIGRPVTYNTAAGPGHFVPAGTDLPASKLGFSETQNTVTLYLESVRVTDASASADAHRITVRVTAATGGSSGGGGGSSGGGGAYEAEDQIAVSGVRVVIPEPSVRSMSTMAFAPIAIDGLRYSGSWTEGTWWDAQFAGSRVDFDGVEPRAFLLASEQAATGPFHRLQKLAEGTHGPAGGAVYRMNGPTVRVLGGLIDDTLGAPAGTEKPERVARARVLYGLYLPVMRGFVEPGRPGADPMLAGLVRVENRPTVLRPRYVLVDAEGHTGDLFSPPPYGSPSFTGMGVKVDVGEEEGLDIRDAQRWALLRMAVGTPDALVEVPADDPTMPRGPGHFWLRGSRPGAMVWRVFVRIDDEAALSRPVYEVAVENEPVVISEPDPATLDVARANVAARRAVVGDEDAALVEAPTPLPDEAAYDSTVSGSTESAREVDRVRRYCLYVLSQLVKPNDPALGDGLELLEYPAEQTDQRLGEQQLRTILLAQSGAASVYELLDTTGGGPAQQALWRAERVRDDGGELAVTHRELQMAARRHADLAALYALRWSFSMTRDGNTVAATGPWEQSVHHGGDVPIAAYGFWASVLHLESPLEQMFADVEGWRVGHPFTEDVVRHMILERYALLMSTLRYLEQRHGELNATTQTYGPHWPLKTIRHPQVPYWSGAGAVEPAEMEAVLDVLEDKDFHVFDLIGERWKAAVHVNLRHNAEAALAAAWDDGGEAPLVSWSTTEVEDAQASEMWLDPDLYDALPAGDRDRFLLRSKRVGAQPGLDQVAWCRWTMRWDGGSDATMNTAGRLARKTLDEIGLLRAMLDDVKTQQWWADLRSDGILTSYVPFMVGDFLFDIQGFHNAATGSDLITDEHLTIGQRVFAGGMAIASVVPWGKIVEGGRIVMGSARHSVGVLRGLADKSIAELTTVPAELAPVLERLRLRGIDPTGAAAGSEQAVRRLRRDTTEAIAAGGPDMIAQVIATDQPIAISTLIASHADDAITLQYGRSSLTAQHASTKGVLGPDRLGKGLRRAAEPGPPRLSEAIGELPQSAPLAGYADAINAPYDVIGDAAVRSFHRQMLDGLTGEARRKMIRTLEKAERSLCFAAGTSVLMADGSTRPIERIAVGDRVLSRHEADRFAPPVAAEVTAVTSRPVDALCRIRLQRAGNARQSHRVGEPRIGIAGGDDDPPDDADADADGNTAFTLDATETHPFYVIGRGWTPAASLAPGDLLRGRRADLRVAAVEPLRPAAPVAVYNLRVAGSHTYFVRPGSPDDPHALCPVVWTHNVCAKGLAFIEHMLARSDLGYGPDDLDDLIAIYRVKRQATWGDIGVAFTEGKSGALRTQIELLPYSSAFYDEVVRMGLFQAQHVVPIEVVKLRRTLLTGGVFEGTSLRWPGVGLVIDDAANGVLLPSKPIIATVFARPYHAGSHPGYTNFMNHRLTQIEQSVIARLNNGDPVDAVLADAIERVRSLQQRTAEVLREGTGGAAGKVLPLHKNAEHDASAAIQAAWEAAIPLDP